jgi:hypothetical protein
MRSLKCLASALVFCAMSQAAVESPTTQSEVVDRIVAQEQLEMQLLRQYAPLVETYIQYVRPDKQMGEVPDGDKYYLGRAELAHGVVLESLNHDPGTKHKIFRTWGEFFSMEFLPAGFLQMIYLDTNGFNRQHYSFVYVGREFLGEVRCLVFDLKPLPKSGKGRFVGRIWVEDQDYHIVRFNGIYGGPSLTSNYFDFDSWRLNVGKNLWLPAFVYSEGPGVRDPRARSLGFKAFRAQTRLWGYDLGSSREEQTLGRLLMEKPSQVIDHSETGKDYSPIQAERSWERMAEVNVTDRLERQGLVAPPGEVDQILETVVNNIEVTNNLDIQPEIRCRVLMTSTLESFTVGHTIVLSRGLIDVLPDEASLASVLAHELSHVVLRHRMDSQFAFFGHLQFDEKGTFRHFEFARTAEEEQAANQKAMEVLKNSPYSERAGAAQTFLQALKDRSKDVPNLVSPHLGNGVMTSGAIAISPAKSGQTIELKPTVNVTAALPIGGRIKVDPRSDQLSLIKATSAGAVAEDEKKPFQVTPLVFYLTRQLDEATPKAPGPSVERLDVNPKP